MSHDDPGAKDATKKYQQIVVPDHALKPDTSGTSFLRTGTFPSLTDTTKQPPGFRKSLELARLAGDHHLKTGGSWHHVDGNRIETTTGRKVEVIRGSYIAHRGPGNSPGPALIVAWPSHSYTQTGSEDLPVGWEPNLNAQGGVILNAQGEETGATQPSPATNDPSGLASALSRHYKESYDPDPGTPGTPGSGPATEKGDAPSISAGDVITTTWAQRILTYQGSSTMPVPAVYAETHAGSWESKTYSHTGDIITLYRALGPWSQWVQDTQAVTIRTSQEAKAAIAVFNTAPNLSTINIGTQEVINLAPGMLTLTAGLGIANITLGVGITNINVGEQLVINVPDRFQFTLDDGHVKMASSAMTALDTRLNGIDSKIGSLENKVLLQRADITATNTQMSMNTLEMHEATHTVLAPVHTWGP